MKHIKLKLVVPLAGMVDIAKERQRLVAEIEQLAKQLAALDGRLANEKFTSKAPPELVTAEQAKATEWRSRLQQLTAKLSALGE